MRIFVIGTRGIPNIQGGVEKHCEKLYPILAEMGYDITVLSRQHYYKEKIKEWKGVKIKYIWTLKKKNIETFIHSFLAGIYSIIKRPDLVVFHNMGPAIFIPMVRAFGIKTIFTYHSINYAHKKWGIFASTVLRIGEVLGIIFSNIIIVISDETKTCLEKRYHRWKFQYIPNGVDIPSINQNNGVLRRFGLEQGKYFLFVGRYVHEKGPLDLINAFNSMDMVGYKLVIAGAEDHNTNYSREVKNSALKKDNIILTGYLDEASLGELYDNSGLFVLPSYSEGMPIALLEALSYGAPVLATDIPQNGVLIDDIGRLYKAGNIEMLADKMIKLIVKGISEEEKSRIIDNVSTKYCWDKIAIETKELIESL